MVSLVSFVRLFPSLRGARSLVLVALALPAALTAQNGVVTGHVIDEAGTPLVGASVFLVGTQWGGLTHSDGGYRVSAPAGRYAVRARLLGYAAVTDSVTISAGTTTQHDFRLQKAASSLEAVTVLGARGQERTVLNAPVPIDVLPAAEIRSTGRTETAQMLQAVAPSVNFPRTTLGDATDNVRPATLRGLSPDQALVLVNGKRRHLSSIVNINGFVGRGSEAVDLNAIPASMIDHIEILRDGAAAQYGSDAIAGVVNIVLKSTAAGDVTTQVGEFRTNEPGLGKRDDGKLFYANADKGWAFGQNSYVFVGGEVRDRGYTNRAAPDPRQQYFTGDPRNADPNMPVPGRLTFKIGDSYNHDLGGFLNAGTTLANGVQLYAFGGLSHRFGDAFAFWRRPQDDNNVRQIYPNGFLPEEQPNIWDGSGFAGVKGKLVGWDYDLSTGYGRNSFQMNVVNSVNVSLGPTSPRSFDAGTMSFGQWTTNLDVNRDFEVGLQAPLHAAWGLEFRDDHYKITPGDSASYASGPYTIFDANGNPTTRPAPVASQAYPGFRPQDAVDQSRNNVAGYVEFSNDITKQLFLDIAGRTEHYSDFGSTTTGKISGRFEPIKNYSLRGAISSGFRAPSLGQEFFSNTAINFVNGVPLEIRTFPVESREAQLLNARPLKPERSVNYSAGIAMEPVRALAITADYYRIDIKDRIVLSNNFTGADVVNVFNQNGLAGLQGGRYFTNAVDTKTSGVDVVVNYGWNLTESTLLRLTGSYNVNRTHVTRVDTSTVLGGHSDQLFNRVERTRLERGQPRDNAFASAALSHGLLELDYRSHLYGPVTQFGTATSGANDQTWTAKRIDDASVMFGPLRRAAVTLGIDNLWDTYPDKTITVNSFSGILPYSGIAPFGFNGRFFYGKLSIGL